MTSPHDINVEPKPVVHSENGQQNNMVVTQYPGVAYGPAQLQQGNAQSRQHFQGLHHQQNLQSSIVDTIPGDSACTSQKRFNKISREGNVNSSACVSAQHGNNNGTSSNKNSVKHVDCSNVLGPFLKGSNLSNNTGLQRRHSNSALSAATNTAAQTFPLQYQYSPLTAGKWQTSSPQLSALVKENPSDSQTFTTPSSSRHERHRKGSLASLSCVQTKTRNVDHLGGTSSHQRQVSSPSGETELPTDEDIHAFIAKSLKYFWTITNDVHSNNGDRDSTLQSDSMQKVDSFAHRPTTSASYKEDAERQSLNYAMIEEFPTVVGPAVEGGSKASECAASEKHSTEYPQIMTKVSATCTKNEDGRPVVAKAVPGLTWDEVTEKQLSSMFNGSLSEDTYKSLRLNIHNNLDDEGQVPGVSWALKHVIEKGDAALKPVEAVGSDSVQDMTDVSEDLQTRSSSVVSQNITLEPTSLMENQDAKKNIDDQQHYTNIYSSVDEIQIHNVVSIPTNYSDGLSNLRSSEGARKNACSVLSQTDLSLALSENEVKSHAPLSEVPFVKQYEDITDDESQLSNTEHEELSFLAGLEDSQHDEESPPECMAVASSTQVREPTDEQSPFENEGAGHVTKWDSERPSNSVSCSPFSCCDDDDDEDYMLCIPLTISDLTFESEDEDQDRHEKNVLDGGETGDPVTLCYSSPTHCQSLKQVLASVSSPLKVFDTPASFCEAMRPKKICEASGWSSHKHEMDSEGERPAPQNKRESVESCDTEDSCDYSSATENNYLTVSRKLLKKRAAPKLSDDSGSESEGYEGTYVQQGQTSTVDMSGCMQRHSPQIEAKDCCSKDVQPKTNGLNIPKNEDIIIISDSDDESDQSEDESDQSEDESGKKQTKRKRLFSSSSEDSVSPSSQQRHWPKTVDSLCGTVEEKFKINRLPSAESPATKRQSKCFDTPVEEEMLDAYSNLSRSTGKSGELFKTKAASAHIQHKTNSIIVIDPDTEDDDNDDEKPSRKRFLSSGSDSDQKRRSHKTVDSDYEIAKEKHQETRPSSADTSNSRHQSKLHNTQHKTTRPTTTKRRVVFHDSDKEVKKSHFCKKKASTKRIHSSGSEDCGNELFATKNRRLTETDDRLCRDANEKAKKSRLSFEDSPEKQSQSVDKKADSTLGSNPVIPRLAFVKPSQPNKDLLTLFKEPRDGTLSPKASTASSKKTYSLEKEFKLLKPKPANDGQHAIKNNVQANVQKQYRRQLSLPMQEGSSTSFMSSIGKLSEARQSSSSRDLSGENTTSSRLPASKQSTSIPRHSSSSKLQRSLSYTNPSTPNSSCTPTKSPSPMQSSASKQVAKVWKNGYFPTRKDKKSEENLRTRNDHHDGARILSNNSHKSATPMMKKAKCDAIQLTKARSRDVPRKRRYYGGEGYKWSEK